MWRLGISTQHLPRWDTWVTYNILHTTPITTLAVVVEFEASDYGYGSRLSLCIGTRHATAILVGTGVGADRGLLIKGGDVLEQVHQLDTVVFDKTRHPDQGHPTVTDCLPVCPLTPDAFLQLAAAAEGGTCHPLAAATGQSGQGKSIPAAMEFHTEPGLGYLLWWKASKCCWATALNQHLIFYQ